MFSLPEVLEKKVNHYYSLISLMMHTRANCCLLLKLSVMFRLHGDDPHDVIWETQRDVYHSRTSVQSVHVDTVVPVYILPNC